MNIENFAVLIRNEGVTGQVLLTAEQKAMISRIVLGTIQEFEGRVRIVPLSGIELPVDKNMMKGDENE